MKKLMTALAATAALTTAAHAGTIAWTIGCSGIGPCQNDCSCGANGVSWPIRSDGDAYVPFSSWSQSYLYLAQAKDEGMILNALMSGVFHNPTNPLDIPGVLDAIRLDTYAEGGTYHTTHDDLNAGDSYEFFYFIVRPFLPHAYPVIQAFLGTDLDVEYAYGYYAQFLLPEIYAASSIATAENTYIMVTWEPELWGGDYFKLVPEPMTGVLVLVGGAVLALKRRRRK